MAVKPWWLEGRTLAYLDHPYNITAQNERAIEVPIAEAFIDTHPGEGLEVGNVLSHYLTRDWLVVDKYETGPDVINVDVVDFDPPERFDWIVTVSTLEHVGWDEPTRDPPKCLEALLHLRKLLTIDGRLLVTIPTGWNSYLDSAIPDLVAVWSTFLTRPGSEWFPTDFEPIPYDHENHTARGLWIGEFTCA